MAPGHSPPPCFLRFAYLNVAALLLLNFFWLPFTPFCNAESKPCLLVSTPLPFMACRCTLVASSYGIYNLLPPFTFPCWVSPAFRFYNPLGESDRLDAMLAGTQLLH